jgi:hypothetical protein
MRAAPILQDPKRDKPGSWLIKLYAGICPIIPQRAIFLARAYHLSRVRLQGKPDIAVQACALCQSLDFFKDLIEAGFLPA